MLTAAEAEFHTRKTLHQLAMELSNPPMSDPGRRGKSGLSLTLTAQRPLGETIHSLACYFLGAHLSSAQPWLAAADSTVRVTDVAPILLEPRGRG